MKKLKSLFLTVMAAAAALLLCGCPKNNETVPAEETVPLDDSAVVSTAKSTVHFLAVGDNIVHSSIFEQAHRRGGGMDYDFTYAYSNAADLVKAADLAMMNQETLICNDKYEPSDEPNFNSPTQVGDHMMYIGFDIFTIANNHVLDYGDEGLRNCLDYWDSRSKAVVAGVYRNENDRSNIRTITSNNIKFSILAYTESVNGGSVSDSSIIIGDANDREAIEADIAAAKRISDVCVVAMHWGDRNSDEVNSFQKETAQMLADAGADIIIGTHPHVLQKIEMLDRKDGGKTLCAYSLGNFISGQSKVQNLIGGILEFDVVPESGDFSVTNITLKPVISHYGPGYSDNRLYLYPQYNGKLASEHGANKWSNFSMEYIDSVVKKNIDEQYLDLN